MVRKASHRNDIRIAGLSNEKLLELGNSMGLGLNTDELRMLQQYFDSLNRDPSEIEMHAMAQAWSEHCCYKSSKFYLKKFLSDLRTDDVILAMEDDAGVVEFDPEHVYVLKMESHNHPSAVEPYGGAATGVGGIIRDVLCMGAQPVGLLDSLFFGNFTSDLKQGLSERFIFNRVVAGIRDYGNRMGIPTVAGSIDFDRCYANIPLVNAGCIGIARKDHIVRSRVSKSGDILLLAGGKTGRDGIHGVNFASRSLDENRESDIGSIQLGNPVIEEALTHAVLEITDKGLLDGMKDLGGGGLSSSVGELCYSGGSGAIVDLDPVPLKEEGMAPWEIWVSESQERMLMAVAEENLEEVKQILDLWDLENVVIGRVVEDQRLTIHHKGEEILNLDLAFMTSGPVYCRSFVEKTPVEKAQIQPPEPKDFGKFILERLGSLNNCSREPVVRTYDFTVRGNTVTGPLSGYPGSETHSDAAVIKPLEDSYRGLAITSGSRPYMLAGDPYLGTLNLLSESVRNILATGGRPHAVVDALNFGNPENPEVMGDLVSSLRAIRDFCETFNLPVVSGNVSLYNQGHDGNIKPSPVIYMTGLVDDIRNINSSHFTGEGNSIFVVGQYNPDLSGSILLSEMGYGTTGSPRTNLKELFDMIGPLNKASSSGLVHACHDVSGGGLLNTIAEMTFGRSIGASLDLSSIEGSRSMNKLFAEGGNRIVVEVSESDEKEFRSLFSDFILKKIGTTGGSRFMIRDNEITLCDLSVSEAYQAWSGTLSTYL